MIETEIIVNEKRLQEEQMNLEILMKTIQSKINGNNTAMTTSKIVKNKPADKTDKNDKSDKNKSIALKLKEYEDAINDNIHNLVDDLRLVVITNNTNTNNSTNTTTNEHATKTTNSNKGINNSDNIDGFIFQKFIQQLIDLQSRYVFIK